MALWRLVILQESLGNILTIHLSFLACKRTLLQDFIMLFAYFVNKDIDIKSDIYDNILWNIKIRENDVSGP